MDDAYLSKLSVDQIGLKPAFTKDTFDYQIQVASSVSLLRITAVTSDKGASLSIKSGSGYGEECKLTDGPNKIQIEVTSEDGTMKKYFINCLKMSASDAQLALLQIFELDIKPSFDPNVFEYETSVEFRKTQVQITANVTDPECIVELSCNKKQINKQKDDQLYICLLNYGFSEVELKLTSPDKSKTQIYKITIKRDCIPRICLFSSTGVDVKQRVDFEDPISVTAYWRPFKISANTMEMNYSLPFLNIFQKISSPDDLLNVISQSCHDNSTRYSQSLNMTLENKLSEAQVRAPYICSGKFSNEYQLKVLSDKIDEINKEDVFLVNLGDESKKYVSTEIDKMPESLPPYQVKPWEKFLQIIYDETDADKLIELSERHFENYLSHLTKSEPENIIKNSVNDDSPLYFLNMSIFNLATSFKFKTRDFKSHLRLAMLLEEKYLYENIYGPDTKDETTGLSSLTLKTQNNMAIDSSKEEEINAICVQRNYGHNPSDSQKLKALDEEYHYLIESGQNVKAEQVQLLYQFKAKKIGTNPTQKLSKISDNGDFLAKANLKYLDAMSLILEGKQSNFMLNFQLGRSYCMLGEYSQALVYLKSCLDWSDSNYQTMSRYYFAYAMSKSRNLIEPSNSKMIISFLCAGLQLFIANLCITLSNRAILFSQDYLSLLHIAYIEGFLIVGKLKHEFHEKSNDFISAENAFRYCAWLSCLALDEISKRTVLDSTLLSKSILLKDIYTILIETHVHMIKINFSSVYSLLTDFNQIELYRKLQCKQSIGLLSLIRIFPLYKSNVELLRNQENIAQILIFSCPFESYHLVWLGLAKLELYDYLNDFGKKENEADELLNDSKNLLTCSIDLLNQNKPIETVPDTITNQKWWISTGDLVKSKLRASLVKSPSPVVVKDLTQPSKTTQAAKLPVKQAAPVNAASNKKSSVANVKAAPANNQKTAGKAEPPKPANAETSNKPTDSTQNDDQIKMYESLFFKFSKTPASFDANVILIQAELYLARVYSRLKDFNTAKSFYDRVIQKEPKKHDAYIELADMLRSNDDIHGAVEVYASFPVEINSKELSYDDAFVFGELVNILINNQKYDDPRLVKYLILWAQVMGIGIADKYIAILDKANKTNACKQVYAGVHKKQLNDPDLNQFFKFKGWLL